MKLTIKKIESKVKSINKIQMTKVKGGVQDQMEK